MLRCKAINNIEDKEEIVIEMEEEYTNTLLHGLNISIENEKGLLVNTSLSYTEVLDLYHMLTKKICSTQIHMLGIMNKSK